MVAHMNDDAARSRFHHERIAYYLDAGQDESGARLKADAEWRERQAVEQEGLALTAPASLNAKTLAAYSKQIAPVIAGAIDKAVAPIKLRIAELEAAQAEFKYCGVHEAGREYKRGNFATADGSIFHCNRTTTARPGDGDAWTLACKRGRDAR